MDCLIDYIGSHSGCGASTPDSGIYLNQLPGIEFKQFQDIATPDQVTWSGVWSDLQKTSSANFREDVISEFGKRYMLKQLLQTVDLEKGVDASSLTAQAAGIKNGFLAETFQDGNQCIGSNLLQLYVQEINFYYAGNDPAASLTIEIIDADTLVVEYSSTLTPTSGWNQIWVDEGFNSRRIYVLVSGDVLNYVEQDISLFNLNNFGNGGPNWGFSTIGNYLYYNWNACGLQSRIRGVQYTSATNTATTGTNIFGVSAVLSTKCTWDTIVCKNKKHFASAWQYRLAIDFLDARINTSRMNFWTTIDKNQAIKLQEHYMVKYWGIELGKYADSNIPRNMPMIGKLRNAIESIVLNDADGCIKMNDYLIWRETRL